MSFEQQFDLGDGQLLYISDFLESQRASRLMQQLPDQLHWRQDQIQIFGRQVAIPRLQAWYGDSGLDYRYSGLTLRALPWPSILLELKQQIEVFSGYRFNAVLANLYRNGRDSVGWHADDEPELGINPVIASLSLGQPRPFQLRHRHDNQRKHQLELASGSLLLMSGALQHHWHHCLPKRPKLHQPRINLTFRRLI